MQGTFITDIHVNKVRHLSGLNIYIDHAKRKHLIITGRNGAGKTSLLLNLRNYLLSKTMGWISNPQELYNIRNTYNNYLENATNNLNNTAQYSRNNQQNDNYIDTSVVTIDSYQRQRKECENIINYIDSILEGQAIPVLATLSSENDLISNYNQNAFSIRLFDAKRFNYVGNPDGIVNRDFAKKYGILSNANSNFLQYIVNLRAKQSFARDENDEVTAHNIEDWFTYFESQLKKLFEDQNLKLKFDSKNFNFLVYTKDRIPFDLNSMSDGYSSILSIATEIMLRMGTMFNGYNQQGIILIDEIETHLHIDLQKKVLPFLTAFFPNIQFIVTTHSPFILNSISNAVIYDLEKRVRLEDLSGYSMEGIVEGYFQQDKYSNEIKSKIDEFEQLAFKANMTEDEKSRYNFLKDYFDEIPKFYSDELEVKLQQIKLATL